MEDPGGSAGQVFISYVREDSACVDHLQAALEAAGIGVWRDTADLRPGEEWRARIRRVIAGDTQVFLACFSVSGLAREKSYQREELNLAIEELRLRKPDAPWLIPVRFDDCPTPDWSIGADRTLAGLQSADLFGDQLERQTTDLVRAVRAAIDQRSGAAGEEDVRSSARLTSSARVGRPAGRGHELPVVGQVTDRGVLGIHPAIPLPGTADPALPADLPLYVPRDVDPGLRAWVRAHSSTGGFLLLAGPAAAGKTRTAHQLIRDTVGSWPVLIPASARQLARYPDPDPLPPKLVVWLNEAQNYLGPGGLTAAAVRRLLAAPQPVIIIGTIWPERYDALAAPPGPLADGIKGAAAAQQDVNADSREILVIVADRQDLQAAFSPAERHRAASLSHRDPRIAEAMADPDNPNLAETLAAGPQLIRRWLMPSSPLVAAVITAAVTARRCGHPEPVPSQVLKPLAQQAMTAAQRATATPQWFSTALERAREPVRGQAAPLTPQARTPAVIDGDNISDILVQHAARNPAAPWHSIPDHVWMLLIEHASPAACQAIAAAAYPFRAVHQLPAAQRAARKAAGAGYPSAMTNLAILLHEQGQADQAAYWHRRAAKAGDSSAMYNLAFLLAEQGDDDQARQWYQQAAEAGHFGAMSNLAMLLRRQGQADQAERWQRRASAAGQITYVPNREREQPGNPALTEQLARQAAQGDVAAMRRLGYLYERDNQSGRAEHWYRQAADTGDPAAMNNLGLMLARQGQSGQAARWYLKAAGAGDSAAAGAMYNLGQLLSEQDQAEQAEQWYRRSAALGHTAAMTSLGDLLIRQRYTAQAEHWYRKAAAAGDPNAMRKLTTLISDRDQHAHIEHRDPQANDTSQQTQRRQRQPDHPPGSPPPG